MPYWFDGNNIIGIPTLPDRRLGRRRQEFLSHLAAVSAGRGGRFVVFFDGDDQDRRRPPGGVLVRYSAPLAADDEIVRRLESLARPREVIVVTNDRALSARCIAAGSRTQTWSEFEARTSHSRPVSHGGVDDKPSQPVDLEDWLGFFGVDQGDSEN